MDELERIRVTKLGILSITGQYQRRAYEKTYSMLTVQL
jgi:hypothetical protein